MLSSQSKLNQTLVFNTVYMYSMCLAAAVCVSGHFWSCETEARKDVGPHSVKDPYIVTCNTFKFKFIMFYMTCSNSQFNIELFRPSWFNKHEGLFMVLLKYCTIIDCFCLVNLHVRPNSMRKKTTCEWTSDHSAAMSVRVKSSLAH